MSASAPYLHDGRARTLDEAIELHDGQAAGSQQAFVALSPEERERLVAFLGALSTP